MNGELKNLAFLKPPFFRLQVKNNNTNPCFIQEVSDYNCVYRNEVHHTAGERTQVLQDVASDPTLPRTKTVRCALCGHGEAVFFQVFFFLFCLVSFSWPSFPCDAIWMTWSIKQYAKILQFVNVTVGCCIPLCFFAISISCWVLHLHPWHQHVLSDKSAFRSQENGALWYFLC